MKAIRRAMMLVAAVLLVTACGGSSAATTTQAPATTSGPTTTLPAGTVKITLADIDATTMAMTAKPNTAPAGSVTFLVTNTGKEEHEFVVLKTDLAAADLPYDATADEINEDADGVTNVGEVEGVQPGETKTLTLDLEAGHYALVCNIKGHWKMGMRTDFTVGG